MISSKAAKRVNLEINQMKTDTTEGIEIIPTENIERFISRIKGPEQSPYENGIYDLEVKIPSDYPISPPNIKFITQMFHPNVYPDGKICVDILRKDQWSPSLKISTALLSIRSLFTDPDPTSSANPKAGRLYVSDREKFNKEVEDIKIKNLFV